MPRPRFRALNRPAPAAPTPAPAPAAKPKKEKVGLLERVQAPPSITKSLGAGASVLVGSILLLGIVLAAVSALSVGCIFLGLTIIQNLH